MAYRDSKQAIRALYDLANTQGGYFTAKQAAASGYTKQHVDYHAKVGNFSRLGHGLYRLPTVPLAEHDDLVRLSFWSRGRDDRPQAVVSHESALALHNLSDVIPGRVHLTVPPSFRKRAPKGCVLHKAKLQPADSQEWTAFRVTTPLRTLIDAAGTPGITQEQLFRAAKDALERGLVRKVKLSESLKNHPQSARLSSWLASAS